MSEKVIDGQPTDDMPAWLRFYIKLRQFFQPYYRYFPKSQKKKKKSAASASQKPIQTTPQQKKKKPQADARRVSTPKPIESLRVADYPVALTKVMSFKKKPSLGIAWCYHDQNVHQVVAHVAPKSGYLHKTRDDLARGRLRPQLWPRQNKPFDRTHLLPIGYHGSENDPRLLVGWDSDANRGPFMHFEKKQKKRKQDIYWCTFITRLPRGARWQYFVYDASTLELLDELEHTMTCEFVWK